MKCLLTVEIKWVVQTMSPRERESIAVKRYYRPHVSRLWRTDPH